MAPPALAELEFDASIHQPIAQITVINAAYGDSCLVDFCTKPLIDHGGNNWDYDDDSWMRTLIDTGPTYPFLADADGKPQKLASLQACLKHVVLNQTLPAAYRQPRPAVPLLNRLLITHPDDDHIGNALSLLKSLSTNMATIQDLTVAFCALPKDLAKPPEIWAYAPEAFRDANIGDTNQVVFEAGPNEDWALEMKQAGFEIRCTLTPAKLGADLATDDYRWDQVPDGYGDVENATWILTYTEDAVTNKVLPKMTCKAEIYYRSADSIQITVEDKRYKQTRKYKGVKQIKGQLYATPATVVRKDPKITPTYYTKVSLPASLRKILRTSTVSPDPNTLAPFELEWVDYVPPKKKKKTGQVFALVGDMSRVTIAPHIPMRVMAASEVFDLTTYILELNTKHGGNLSLWTPERGERDGPDIWDETLGQEIILGPGKRQYRELLRDMMLTRYANYALDATLNINRGGTGLKISGEVTNRASVINIFEQPDQDPSQEPYRILFTGDAFDQACDIRDSLYQWKLESQGYERADVRDEMIMYVDVLKVPHHGSAKSTESGFFKYVRADIYIFEASIHDNDHGNPRLSTLIAIVKTFKDRKARNGGPLLIFFSDPLVQNHNLPNRSCVADILKDPDMKPTDSNGRYYYKMYRLSDKDAKGVPVAGTGVNACGSILIGKDAHSNPVVKWNANQWTECK